MQTTVLPDNRRRIAYIYTLLRRNFKTGIAADTFAGNEVDDLRNFRIAYYDSFTNNVRRIGNVKVFALRFTIE